MPPVNKDPLYEKPYIILNACDYFQLHDVKRLTAEDMRIY